LPIIELKYPENIVFMALAAAAIFFFVLAYRKKERIMAAFHMAYRLKRKALRIVLLGAGLGLIGFSLLGPQMFEGYADVKKTGMDIYVLMDTSKSMLVTDIAPDRMTIAKKIVGNLLDNLDGDRVGFIPFASDAYIQMPLTDDYRLAHMFLDVMDTDMIGGGGTNIAAAIRLADSSFDRAMGTDRVILILSDGEEHDASSIDVLRSIKDDSLKVFTIGVGTEKGGLVPIYDDTGTEVFDYIRDEGGNPVTSRLEAENLMRLALEGGGAYYQATLQGIETAALQGELDNLQRETRELEQVRRFSHLYQYFLGIGIILFLLAWFLPERRDEA